MNDIISNVVGVAIIFMALSITGMFAIVALETYRDLRDRNANRKR